MAFISESPYNLQISSHKLKIHHPGIISIFPLALGTNLCLMHSEIYERLYYRLQCSH